MSVCRQELDGGSGGQSPDNSNPGLWSFETFATEYLGTVT